MKLQITDRKVPDYGIITDPQQRKYIDVFFPALSRYYLNSQDKSPESYLSKYLATNQNYINYLLKLINFLYSYYELDQKYFDLLDLAAKNITILYSKKILDAAGKDDVATIIKLNSELAGYFNKAAMIFQTAADKTEMPLSSVYKVKAEEYSEKADELHGVETSDYMAKMLGLYEQDYHLHEGKPPTDPGYFIKDFALARLNEFRQKYEADHDAVRQTQGVVLVSDREAAAQAPPSVQTDFFLQHSPSPHARSPHASSIMTHRKVSQERDEDKQPLLLTGISH